MDLNCLTWILAIVMAEQLCLHAMVSFVPLFLDLKATMQNLPPSKTNYDVGRGKE